MINMGNCYYMLQDYEMAISTFKEVLDKEPENPMALRNLAHLYGLVGNNEMQLYYEQKAEEVAR